NEPGRPLATLKRRAAGASPTAMTESRAGGERCVTGGTGPRIRGGAAVGAEASRDDVAARRANGSPGVWGAADRLAHGGPKLASLPLLRPLSPGGAGPYSFSRMTSAPLDLPEHP